MKPRTKSAPAANPELAKRTSSCVLSAEPRIADDPAMMSGSTSNKTATISVGTEDSKRIGSQSIRVAVVEDDEWVRNSLAEQIQDCPKLTCVSRHRTAEEALADLPAARPDVVLMDINLPGMSGIECVRRLKEKLPDVNVLMLTVYEESEKIFDSLKAGASGYLLKRSSRQELLEAIASVHVGGSPMTGAIARKVVQFFKQLGQPARELETLSPREREILERLGEGAAYKEIADALALSIDTVRMHIRGAYRKLHVHSRGEAVARYLRR